MPLGKLGEETAKISSFYANMLRHPCGPVYNTLPDAFIAIHQHCLAQCLHAAPTTSSYHPIL